uniref:L-serine ammonia-lyase n=1 Tax=Arcella intermedia TaxID=1963864 RepID=A0A6B2LA06_9EUKA
MGKPITVFVPDNVHPKLKRKMELEGANVVVHGKVWADAHQKAIEFAKAVPHCEVVHPFDHEDLWEGHASIITEAAGDLKKKPQAVLCVVGGGGLMVGLLRGMHKVGWEDVPLIVSETTGAASFAAAVEAGKLVTLPTINTIAKTLGASTVAKEAFDWTKRHKIVHRVVTDREVLEAIVRFQEDHQFLVEPSCGAGLALLYSEKHSEFLLRQLQGESKKDREGVLVVICGGNGVDIDMIEEWNKNKASL